MKILNILVNHTVEPLRSHIVRYLLDAGHFVYLIGLSDAERTRWTGSQHNLFAIPTLAISVSTMSSVSKKAHR